MRYIEDEIKSIEDDRCIFFDDGTIWHKRIKKWVGLSNSHGYLQVRIDGKTERVHRVIYEKFNGKIPSGIQVDHINNCRTDNRIQNLQLLTNQQNTTKKLIKSNNTSGYTGIYFHKRDKNWQVRIYKNGKDIYYKSGFKTAAEANDARNKFIDENPEICKYYIKNKK